MLIDELHLPQEADLKARMDDALNLVDDEVLMENSETITQDVVVDVEELVHF